MTPAEAARLLGIATDAPWSEVRRAYHDRIRRHHPDLRAEVDRGRARPATDARAVQIIEAYGVLEAARADPGSPPFAPVEPAAPAAPTAPAEPAVRFARESIAFGAPPEVVRVDDDTLALDAPADEAFRWLVEVAHDIGEITYLDRSVPILEILCRFVGEPATSLVVTTQGRMDRTDALCHVESIEDRPAPPSAAVVDVLEAAFRDRLAAW